MPKWSSEGEGPIWSAISEATGKRKCKWMDEFDKKHREISYKAFPRLRDSLTPTPREKPTFEKILTSILDHNRAQQVMMQDEKCVNVF